VGSRTQGPWRAKWGGRGGGLDARHDGQETTVGKSRPGPCHGGSGGGGGAGGRPNRGSSERRRASAAERPSRRASGPPRRVPAAPVARPGRPRLPSNQVGCARVMHSLDRGAPAVWAGRGGMQTRHRGARATRAGAQRIAAGAIGVRGALRSGPHAGVTRAEAPLAAHRISRVKPRAGRQQTRTVSGHRPTPTAQWCLSCVHAQTRNSCKLP